MGRNLLLGNGINAHLDVRGMKNNEIKERFSRALINANEFFGLMFNTYFTEENCEDIFSKSKNIGIETLAKGIYDFVKRNSSLSFNDELRLLNAITCCGITAIFYDKDRILGKNYNKYKLPDFSKYENIFSLNYIEVWDENKRCVYLHGQYDISSVKENGREVLVYDEERFVGYNGYREIVTKMQKDFNMIGLNTYYVIFSPEFHNMEENLRHNKEQLINMGSFPAEDREPGEDIFPSDPRKLYEELSEIRNIEIFGMSPYGDDEIIKMLNCMNHVVVYIYDIENNSETKDWNRVLSCPHKLVDSREIMR